MSSFDTDIGTDFYMFRTSMSYEFDPALRDAYRFLVRDNLVNHEVDIGTPSSDNIHPY